MKKTLFGVLTMFVVVAMTSCGSSKTPEQIEADAQKKFETEKAKLDTEATAACDAQKSDLIKKALDSLTAVHNAAHPEAPIAAPVQ